MSERGSLYALDLRFSTDATQPALHYAQMYYLLEDGEQLPHLQWDDLSRLGR